MVYTRAILIFKTTTIKHLTFLFSQLMSSYFVETEIPFSELDEQCRSEDIRIFKFALKK